jgi:hypothetical protein
LVPQTKKREQPFPITQSPLREVEIQIGVLAPKIKPCLVIVGSDLQSCLKNHRSHAMAGEGRDFQPAGRFFCAKGHPRVGFAERGMLA